MRYRTGAVMLAAARRWFALQPRCLLAAGSSAGGGGKRGRGTVAVSEDRNSRPLAAARPGDPRRAGSGFLLGKGAAAGGVRGAGSSAPGRDSPPGSGGAREPGEGLAAAGRAGGGPGRAGAGGGAVGRPARCSRAHGDTPNRAVGPRALGLPPGGRPGLRAAPHHLPGRARRRPGGAGGAGAGATREGFGAAAGLGEAGAGRWYKDRAGDTAVAGVSFLFLSPFYYPLVLISMEKFVVAHAAL